MYAKLLLAALATLGLVSIHAQAASAMRLGNVETSLTRVDYTICEICKVDDEDDEDDEDASNGVIEVELDDDDEDDGDDD